jgi:peptidoglycan/LPS O-acetylase OafA/YrhL
MTKPEKIFKGLDTLRALAISLVFLFHYSFFHHPAWMGPAFQSGWIGVDLFFVLSGFLISNQLFEEWQNHHSINTRVFYLKRAFRILPPYWVILLIYEFVPAFHERERLAPFWKMITFTQNFNQHIDVYGTFSHAWSLCVEEQFYLLLPAVLILVFLSRLKRHAGWLVPVIFLLTGVTRWFCWHFFLKPVEHTDSFIMEWYRWIYYPTDTRLDGLITGVGIAAAYRFRPSWIIRWTRFARWMLPAGLVLFVASYFLFQDPHDGPSTVFSFSIVALGFGFFVLSAILPGSFLYRFQSAFTKNLATLSYSLYLSHKGIIHLTQHFLSGSLIASDSIWMLLICMAFCLLGAWLMRIGIEKPAMRMRNWVLAKRFSAEKSARPGLNEQKN